MKLNNIVNNADIAIIGMDGRFPGANNIDEFWKNLKNQVDSVTFFSEEELQKAGLKAEIINHPNYVKANHILADVELFDAEFFNISKQEAEIIDPQQRIFLECAYNTIENAGYNPDTYKGAIGVYAGIGMNTYILNNLYQKYKQASSVDHYQLMLANDKDFLSTRVSYKLNLKGPSININTACSTSLVAVHMACLSLLNGECDMALAGSASVRVPQHEGYLHQDGMIFSPDGHCRAFDAKAQGTLLGDGVGIVMLKRLSDALEDGDSIHAIIKGSAINNDGAMKTAYTAPGFEGQQAVISEAHAISDVDVETITYVEAHGTGTHLGDPIEIAALTAAFRKRTEKRSFCALGSVKTNIGHLDAAAGMAGLLKTVLMLKHQTLVPSLHYDTPNPNIDFANSPFHVQTQSEAWLVDDGPRRAGVSAFGIGGTNSHVILEEALLADTPRPPRTTELLLLSAKSESALKHMNENLAKHLKQNHHLVLGDVAYTLAVGRKAYTHRKFLLCEDIGDAALTLVLGDEERVVSGQAEPGNTQVVWLLSAWPEAEHDFAVLYAEQEVFRATVRYCSDLLLPKTGLDIQTLVAKAHMEKLVVQNPADAQAILFVTHYALAKLWLSLGVKPASIIGHGIGEAVAACLAGVFSLEDALELVAARCQIIRENPEVSAFLSQKKMVELNANDAMLAPYQEMLRSIEFNAPNIAFISNVSGTWISKEQATDRHYWLRQLFQTEGITQHLAEIINQPQQLLLEISPSKSLTALIQQQPICCCAPRFARPSTTDQNWLLSTLGSLWLAGIDIAWDKFYDGHALQRIPLPGYPFQRKRYWVDAEEHKTETLASELLKDILTASSSNRKNIIINYLQGEIAAILGSSAPMPDPQQNLLEGRQLDSLTLIEIIAKLGVKLNIAIPSSALIEYPTISSFADNVIVSLALSNENRAEEPARTSKKDLNRKNRHEVMDERRKLRRNLL